MPWRRKRSPAVQLGKSWGSFSSTVQCFNHLVTKQWLYETGSCDNHGLEDVWTDVAQQTADNILRHAIYHIAGYFAGCQNLLFLWFTYKSGYYLPTEFNIFHNPLSQAAPHAVIDEVNRELRHKQKVRPVPAIYRGQEEASSHIRKHYLSSCKGKRCLFLPPGSFSQRLVSKGEEGYRKHSTCRWDSIL